MLVLVSSATHIWERVIPCGGVHCHWKEPSLATVQERLATDTTSSGPGGTGSSTEGGCRNVIDGGVTVDRDNNTFCTVGLVSSYMSLSIMVIILISSSTMSEEYSNATYVPSSVIVLRSPPTEQT